MKSSCVFLRRLLLPAAWLYLATFAQGQSTVVVNGNTTFQTIRGWGGNTYSWVTNGWNGWTNDEVFNIAFNKLGTTHVRVVTEFEHWEPVNDDDDPDHFNWSYYQSRFNGTDISSRLVQGDFKMMEKATKEFGKQINVGIWDVPNWMIQDSTLKDHRNLPYRMYREFAESVAAYLLWARDRRGINIPEIVIANEPDGHNVKYAPLKLRDLIKTVGAKLAREGLAVKIIAPDLSSPYYDPDTWLLPLLNDPVAASYLGAVSYHTYYAFGTPDKWNSRLSRIAELAATKNLPVYYTEIGTTPNNKSMKTWAWTFECMQMWHNVLTYGNASLTYHWTLLGKDSAVNPDTSRNHIFFALKHFFGHVSPGAVRIAANSNNPALLVSAFKHAGKNRMQIVLINRSLSAQTAGITLNNLNVLNFLACRTSATEKHRSLANVPVVDNKLMVTIPANAIVTLDGVLVPALGLIHEDATPSVALNLLAYPNPLHQNTQIHFTLPQAAEVNVAILDLLGREVRELIAAPLAAGNHAVSWERRNRDGVRLPSGLYWVRLRYRTEAATAWTQAVQRLLVTN